MDVLTDKKYNKYDYLCRDSGRPSYYHSEDGKRVLGLGTNVFKDIPYTIHPLKEGDTLDSLSLKYYNNPTYFWVLAYFNNIPDALEEESLLEYYTSIKIPNIANIRFGDSR